MASDYLILEREDGSIYIDMDPTRSGQKGTMRFQEDFNITDHTYMIVHKDHLGQILGIELQL